MGQGNKAQRHKGAEAQRDRGINAKDAGNHSRHIRGQNTVWFVGRL